VDGLIVLALVTKNHLHHELADLGVKLLDLTDLILSFFDFTQEHLGHAFDRLPFPRAHLRWVVPPLGCDLLHRPVTTQRFKRHSSLKLV